VGERAAVLLTVAYDGTAFSGWARQPGQRTVQGTLEDAIASMNGASVELRGASRTDAGVHALGQRAAFDPARDIPPQGWLLGLNAALPDDLAVRAAEPAPADYTPRFDTVDKHYRYLVLLDSVRDPLLRQRAWQLGPRELGKRAERRLDLDAMRAAAAQLVGTHDFRAFRSADDARENTVRTLVSLDVTPSFASDARLVALDVVGTAFMKNMVRILAGTLIEVGTGAREAGSVAALLGPQAERREAGPTAPAHGLTLVSMRLGRGAP
jgi:tRNA pseudouridine38-40 synthase